MPKVLYQFNWVYIVNLAHIFTLNIRAHFLLVSLHCCLLLVLKYDDFIRDYFGKHVRNSPSMNKLQSPRCPERFFLFLVTCYISYINSYFVLISLWQQDYNRI